MEPADGIGAAVGEFAALALRGGFAVNERGGEALLTAIRNLIEWIDEQQTQLAFLNQVAKLGSSNNAEAMKPFLQQVANDEQGFITQLLRLRESLASAETGVRQAMANYQQADHQAAGTLS
ncbi:hypothetical protein [Actinokineospora globicatena]|uniref:hypothetical protein n=1 Tax=Actinokineospora globicatena TaxID=103729 RepID=UPI0020A58ABF|nr:hypothetical protein [Actinokineospora globicatena]MCP2306275.1 hypothetical protein [Actinokineospora globicatena]